MRVHFLKVVLSATAVAGVLVGLVPLQQASAAPANARGVSASVPVMTKPTSMPAWQRGVRSQQSPAATKNCTTTSATKQVCIAVGKPSTHTNVVSPRDAIPFPLWCGDSTGGIPVAAARTEVCRITGLVLTTSQTVNGVTTVTGELDMSVFDFAFSDPNLPNWQHQIGLAPDSGFGPAAQASVNGIMTPAGACTNQGPNSFPTQSLAPTDGNLRVGFAGAQTTATALGAIGQCTTTWNLDFNAPGYPTATASSSMSEIECDNATGANGFRPARVGCVVPWFPATVFYSQSANPTLAAHVAQAQGSGLPGTGFANPLNRTVDPTVIKNNRALACGDAPSILNMSCDEYPLASTMQGLTAGGTRRTFPGCQINAPTGVTGPTGVSACMIAKSDNDSQGGTMSGFYYDNRVLGGDPYLVAIGS